MPYKDVERQRQSVKDWMSRKRDEMRLIVRTAKDNPCVDCGKRYPHYVMDFHHEGDEKKVATISKMVRQPSKYAIEMLKKEIEKCTLLCSNCHRLRHGEHGGN